MIGSGQSHRRLSTPRAHDNFGYKQDFIERKASNGVRVVSWTRSKGGGDEHWEGLGTAAEVPIRSEPEGPHVRGAVELHRPGPHPTCYSTLQTFSIFQFHNVYLYSWSLAVARRQCTTCMSLQGLLPKSQCIAVQNQQESAECPCLSSRHSATRTRCIFFVKL